MNIVISYDSLEKLFNWNIMYISNYSHEYFKINYSDSCCVLENVYINIPHPDVNPDKFKEFENLFETFKISLFNRCKMSMTSNKQDYIFETSNVIDITNVPKYIRINNIKVNDNVICLNYDNIY